MGILCVHTRKIPMPYNVKWYDAKKRVILISVIGEFTLQESSDSSVEIRNYINEGTPPIHLIGDLTKLKQAPKSIAELRKAQGNLNSLASTIIVGANNPMIRFMANVFAKLGGYEVRTVDSVDQAAEVISRLDPTLEHLTSVSSN